MPALLQSTAQALGGDSLPHCDSRSLLLTRYALPLPGQDRKPALSRMTNAARHPDAAASSQAWVHRLPQSRHLYARLDSRLLLNVSGSVMENAGLALDRYGVATIPGSAVKGCARRTALATLHEWCHTDQKPADGHPLAPAAAAFEQPVDLMLAVVRVFGCTDLEWQPWDAETRKGSDLAWACDHRWPALRAATFARLDSDPGGAANEPTPKRRGGVAFLPAFPTNAPAKDLELDVLTSHHPEYYAGKRAAATDDEDPIPVYFPAVAAGAEYLFTLAPLAPAADATLLTWAEQWLTTGLTTFGLGARTAAGYGLFSDLTPQIRQRAETRRLAQQAAADAAADKARHEADLAARRARETARANMTPEQRADADLADRAADWGWMKPHLSKFAQHSAETQAAILRWLAGAGRERWVQEIKPEAAKGRKPWSQIIGAINAAKKTHRIELP